MSVEHNSRCRVIWHLPENYRSDNIPERFFPNLLVVIYLGICSLAGNSPNLVVTGSGLHNLLNTTLNTTLIRDFEDFVEEIRKIQHDNGYGDLFKALVLSVSASLRCCL